MTDVTAAGGEGVPGAALAAWPLFASVPDDLLATVAEQSRRVLVPRGEHLFLTGSPATSFFGVVSGLVQLAVSHVEGTEKVVEIIRPGQTLGEAVMFLGRRRPVSARALEDSDLIEVPADVMDALFERDPRFARSLVASLSLKLHSLIKDVEMYSLHSATERVVGHLLGLLAADPDGGRVAFEPSKAVVASRLGMKPETLSRVLRELTDAGLIVPVGRQLSIPDAATLGALLSHR